MDRLQNVLKSQTNNKKQTEMCHAMSYWLQVCEMRHLENKHSTYRPCKMLGLRFSDFKDIFIYFHSVP